MRVSWSSRFGAYTIFTRSKMCWSARDSRAIQITGMLKVETRPEFAHTTHAPRALSHAMRSHTHRARRARAPLSLPPVPLPCSAARTCAHAHAHTHTVFRSPCLCSALGSRLSALGSRLPHTTRQTHAHVRTSDPHARPPTRQRMRALFDGRRTRLTPLTRLTRRRALRHAPRAPPSSPRGIS
jgi:hypothetical protein